MEDYSVIIGVTLVLATLISFAAFLLYPAERLGKRGRKIAFAIFISSIGALMMGMLGEWLADPFDFDEDVSATVFATIGFLASLFYSIRIIRSVSKGSDSSTKQ